MTQHSSLRILVAEDSRSTALVFGKLLESRGFQVRVVLNGLAAIDVLRDFKPQIVLLDVGMPVLDGHEVTRQIRQEPGFENVPIVVISGYGQESDKQKSREAGANHHLVKPVDFDALWTILSQYAAEIHQPSDAS